MIDGFQFVHDGRTFTCSVGPMGAAHVGSWWWFRVSTDGHRYAPFHAVATDTLEGVRSRVAAYYDQLLARRAAPREHYFRRGRRPTPVPATPVEPAAESVL
jgi:hypothetical protein